VTFKTLALALRNIALRFSLVMVGVVVAFALLELAVRILYPYDLDLQYDPLLGHRLIPDFEGWHSSLGEYRVRYHINSHGFRGEETTLEKPDGTYRIMVLGDSFVTALEVEEDETFPAQLEALLTSADAPVEVLNAGIPGAGPAQYMLYLESEGIDYNPDLVLVVHTASNDAIDTLNYNSVDWDKQGPITLDDVHDASTISASFFEERPRGFHPLIFGHLSGILSRIPAAWRTLGNSESFVHFYFQVYSPEPVEAIEESWQITEDVYARLARFQSDTGIPVIVVIYPGALEYNDIKWEQQIDAWPLMEDYSRTLPVERTADVVDSVGLPYISLLPAFDAAWQASGELAYLNYPYDGHPTADGHQLAAETVADYLEDSGLLP